MKDECWSGAWSDHYFNNGKCNLSSLVKQASCCTKFNCEWYPDQGIPGKFVCSTMLDKLLTSADSNKSVFSPAGCRANYANCKGIHFPFFNMYAMRVEYDNSGACYKTGAGYIHMPDKVKNTAEASFWTEGFTQYQKTTSICNLSKTGQGTWSHDNKSTMLYFDGHVGMIRSGDATCSHSSGVKTCAPCRFWFPYMK